MIAGRKEIYECWVQGFADPENVDEAAVQDAVYGALQLAFNNLDSPLMSTYVYFFNSSIRALWFSLAHILLVFPSETSA